MSLFKGAGTALIMPFKDDNVDIESYEKLIDFQLDNGIDALVVNGTTGEPNTMNHKERTLALNTVIKKAKGKVPVIAGTGSNNTHTAIWYTQEAEELGADAALVVTPYYNKCTQAGLIAHYKAVAKSVKIPIILYNVPSRTGLNILPDTVVELAKVHNIIAIKEASGRVDQIMEIASKKPDDFDLYSGEDALVYPLVACGGKGVITVAGNIMPRYMSDMVNKYFDGDIKGSRDMQFKILPLVAALFSEVNPIPIKFAASLMGLCKNEMRLPLTPMANTEPLIKELKALGIQI